MGEQFAAVRAWREDNPRATFPHEAFGRTWPIPVNLPVWAALTMQGATSETGVFDPGQLSTPEFLELAVGILGDEVFAAWSSPAMDLDLIEFGTAVGAAYAAKLIRGRSGGAPAEATASPPRTSSDSGTSSTPPSLTSTANPFDLT